MSLDDNFTKHYFAAIVIIVVAVLLSACGKEKNELIDMGVDYEYVPTMRTTDVETVISDSGLIRYRITAPLWLVFDEAEDPRWNFPKGLHMLKYDSQMQEDASFDCDSAKYLSERKLWRFDSRVKAVNVAGDRFDTEQLFWDSRDKKVYTDSFIHIERSDRIIEGYGFTSNENMTQYVVKKVSGIFPVNEQLQNDSIGDKADTQNNKAAQPRDTIPAQPRLVSSQEPLPKPSPSANSSPQLKPKQLRPSSGVYKSEKIKPISDQPINFQEIKPTK